MAKYCLSDEGAVRLAGAILELAAKDYIAALQDVSSEGKKDKEGSKAMRDECERFFRSRNFGALCSLDPEEVIKNCKAQAELKRFSISADNASA